MSNVAKADLAVRIVRDVASADESVLVVNQMVDAGSPTSGDVPVVQSDGSLAWGASSSTATLAVIRRNAAAMSAVLT